MSDKQDFIRLYRLSGGTAEDGERMWAIKCRDKAAPDMLAALKAIMEWSGTEDGYQALSDEPPWHSQVQAAIAKAEGA